MASVEPVTNQPDQEAPAVAPSAEETPPSPNGKAASVAGTWSSGLCGCCGDIGLCCLGMFCPQILACSVSRKMNECCCAGCIGTASLRTKHRTQHDIQGSVCADNLLSCLCLPCVLCQLGRDLKAR